MAKCLAASNLDTPPDTYLYSLAQVGNTFATIGSDDTLRLFDASLKTSHKPRACHSGVSCLKPADDNALITAGRDGLILVWDPRGKKAAELREPQGRAFSAIACHDHVIAAGTESTKEGLGDVSVLLFDTRNPSVPVREYAESHTDTITQLAFHPTQPQALMSGSTDGLVSVFDVNQPEEEDAIQQVLNPRSAVHCAGFLSAGQAYVVTTDEQFLIYPLAEPADGGERPAAVDFGDVRKTLDCMYVVDVLQQSSGQSVMAYGHNVKQTLSIVQLTGPDPWSFGHKMDLPGAHGEEVVRDVLLTADSSRAFSCGEDGQVKLWKLT